MFLKKGEPLAFTVIQHFAPTEHSIGLHWYHFEQPILLLSFATLSLLHEQTKAPQTSHIRFAVWRHWSDFRAINGSLFLANFVCYHPNVIELQLSRKYYLQTITLSHAGFQLTSQCSGGSGMVGLNCHRCFQLCKKLLLNRIPWAVWAAE